MLLMCNWMVIIGFGKFVLFKKYDCCPKVGIKLSAKVLFFLTVMRFSASLVLIQAFLVFSVLIFWRQNGSANTK